LFGRQIVTPTSTSDVIQPILTIHTLLENRSYRNATRGTFTETVEEDEENEVFTMSDKGKRRNVRFA